MVLPIVCQTQRPVCSSLFFGFSFAPSLLKCKTITARAPEIFKAIARCVRGRVKLLQCMRTAVLVTLGAVLMNVRHAGAGCLTSVQRRAISAELRGGRPF